MKSTLNSPSVFTAGTVGLRTAVLSLAILAGQSAFATNIYWDADGNATTGTPTQSTAGSGTWNTTTALWNANGNSATDQTWNTTNFDNPIFSGADGTYLITLATSSTIGGLQFNASGYTLSAAAASKLTSNGNLAVTVAAGKTATIGANVTIENTSTSNGVALSLTGSSSSSTLIIDSGATVAATYNTGAVVYIGSNATTAGSAYGATVQLNAGGTISGGNSIAVNGLFKVEGGIVNTGAAAAIVIGNFNGTSGVANLTIDSGTVNAGSTGVRFGPSSATATNGGTLNLNGGTLVTNKVFSGGAATTSIVNFNGGTVKASATNTTDFFGSTINSAIVKAGGVVVDTNTYNVTIAKGLVHDTNVTTDGGLTKKSTGNLTLSGANTYNGATTIQAGTLTLASTGLISNSSTIIAGSISGSSANFDVSGVTGGYHLTNGQTLKGYGTVTGPVTVDTGATLAAGNLTAGTLTAKNNITFATGTANFSIRLGQANGHDMLATDSASTVSVLLNGANLELTLGNNDSYLANSLYLILDNINSASSFSGTFAQGSNITVGSEKFNIIYGANFDASGTLVSLSGGNDIALQVVPEPATWSMLLGGFGLLVCIQKMRRQRLNA